MMLTDLRFSFTDRSTIGRLLINDEYFCWLLEDPTRDGPKVKGQTCIPVGVYKVTIDWSKRFQRRMPHILDVPDFDGVRFHWGNKPDDTDGCLLTGYYRAENWVGDSRHAFDDFFVKLENAFNMNEPIFINVMEEK